MVRSQSPLRAVRRSSVREDVVDALRAALISGEMRPGEIYSAPVLAESFGVSATPVREAMLELVREDMIEVARNKGFRVRRLTESELDELVEMRLMLEVPTMGRVAAVYDASMDPQLKHLRQLAQKIERAAVDRDLVEYVQLDTEFHVGFLELHGNASLARTVRELRGRSRLYGLSHLAETRQLVGTVHEHGEMIDHAMHGDIQAIEHVTTTHIGRVRTIWASGKAPGA